MSRRGRVGVPEGVWGESWAVLGLSWVVLRRPWALGRDITRAIPQLPLAPPSPKPPLGPKASEAPRNVIQERPSKAYSNASSINTKTTYSRTENTINRKKTVVRKVKK